MTDFKAPLRTLAQGEVEFIVIGGLAAAALFLSSLRRGLGVAASPDGIHWKLSDKPKAWSRTIQWDDGTRTKMHDVEVPKLYFENGVPTHLIVTVREGGTIMQPDKIRIVVIPLKP